VQFVFTPTKAPDFDLTPVELSLTEDTNAVVIERIAAPELVLGTQNQ